MNTAAANINDYAVVAIEMKAQMQFSKEVDHQCLYNQYTQCPKSLCLQQSWIPSDFNTDVIYCYSQKK